MPYEQLTFSIRQYINRYKRYLLYNLLNKEAISSPFYLQPLVYYSVGSSQTNRKSIPYYHTEIQFEVQVSH